jgi:hypothetical protein
MAQTVQYTVGWTAGGGHDFLSGVETPSTSMAYALITCLDGCFDLPLMVAKSRSLNRLREKGRLTGRGLLLTTRQLVAAERRQRLFHGFDEVWFFARRPARAKARHAQHRRAAPDSTRRDREP